ncbi:hypothetical protein ACLESO_60095, partial [Pyxidicoccus sp. 3LG]
MTCSGVTQVRPDAFAAAFKGRAGGRGGEEGAARHEGPHPWCWPNEGISLRGAHDDVELLS